MKQGKKLLILPAVAVLLGMGTGCSDNSENEVSIRRNAPFTL